MSDTEFKDQPEIVEFKDQPEVVEFDKGTTTEENNNMAKIVSKNLTLPQSNSADVVDYKMYIEEAPTALTYDSPSVSLGNDVVDGNIEKDLSEYVSMFPNDAEYNLGFTSVDDIGNESDMVEALNVPFDFVAPNPPGTPIITG